MDPSRESAGGGGRFRSDPHLSLAPFVVEYWAIARDLAAMGGFTITPDCFGELICCVDDLDLLSETGREKLPRCFFVGLLKDPLRIESKGVIRCMSARLRPWAVGRFLDGAPNFPGRGWKEAGSVFGPRLATVSTLIEQCDWPSLVGIFDQILIEEVGRWRPAEIGEDLVGSFLGEDRPPTAAVAEAWETSGRQIERRVRSLTGTSPRQLASLSRFQKVRDAIWADPSVDLARLAIEAGYSDQPHLTREFRRYAGLTPARFAREASAQKTRLPAGDVAIVQDQVEPDGLG